MAEDAPPATRVRALQENRYLVGGVLRPLLSTLRPSEVFTLGLTCRAALALCRECSVWRTAFPAWLAQVAEWEAAHKPSMRDELRLWRPIWADKALALRQFLIDQQLQERDMLYDDGDTLLCGACHYFSLSTVHDSRDDAFFCALCRPPRNVRDLCSQFQLQYEYGVWWKRTRSMWKPPKPAEIAYADELAAEVHPPLDALLDEAEARVRRDVQATDMEAHHLPRLQRLLESMGGGVEVCDLGNIDAYLDGDEPFKAVERRARELDRLQQLAGRGMTREETLDYLAQPRHRAEVPDDLKPVVNKHGRLRSFAAGFRVSWCRDLLQATPSARAYIETGEGSQEEAERAATLEVIPPELRAEFDLPADVGLQTSDLGYSVVTDIRGVMPGVAKRVRRQRLARYSRVSALHGFFNGQAGTTMAEAREVGECATAVNQAAVRAHMHEVGATLSEEVVLGMLPEFLARGRPENVESALESHLNDQLMRATRGRTDQVGMPVDPCAAVPAVAAFFALRGDVGMAAQALIQASITEAGRVEGVVRAALAPWAPTVRVTKWMLMSYGIGGEGYYRFRRRRRVGYGAAPVTDDERPTTDAAIVARVKQRLAEPRLRELLADLSDEPIERHAPIPAEVQALCGTATLAEDLAAVRAEYELRTEPLRVLAPERPPVYYTAVFGADQAVWADVLVEMEELVLDSRLAALGGLPAALRPCREFVRAVEVVDGKYVRPSSGGGGVGALQAAAAALAERGLPVGCLQLGLDLDGVDADLVREKLPDMGGDESAFAFEYVAGRRSLEDAKRCVAVAAEWSAELVERDVVVNAFCSGETELCGVPLTLEAVQQYAQSIDRAVARRRRGRTDADLRSDASRTMTQLRARAAMEEVFGPLPLVQAFV